MSVPVSGEQHERAVEAGKQGAVESARKRGFRGNDLEAWPIHADARAAIDAYFASLAERGVRLVDLREVKLWLRERRDQASRGDLMTPADIALERRFGGHEGSDDGE